MAKYNKGGGGDSLGAKDLVGDQVWAIYPHALDTVETKMGPSRALRAEVYELTEGGAAVRHGSALFFQTVLLKLPVEEWSVGMMFGPDERANYYRFEYPGEQFDDMIDAGMASLPEHPELPEEPFPAERRTAPPPTGGQTAGDEDYTYDPDEAF